MRILGVIPARYGSTRLPGKVLMDIAGRSMLQRVFERVSRTRKLASIVVATDDERVLDHARSFGAEAVMTAPDHPSGTDRCSEALQAVGGGHDAVINIQGDEPFLDPGQIDLLCDTLSHEGVQIVTLAKPILSDPEIDDPKEAHVVVDKDMNALYFSRAGIPFLRDGKGTPRHLRFPFLKHVGVYGFRAEVLSQLVALPASALEQAEGLEQLRWLENGFRVRLVLTEHDSFCVDTAEDLEEAVQRARSLER
ncbi:MAG: 3-deoxy-manno-octulosonate cytidylyltransferase [Flavobacteriales bacterium]|nr:3-deoxy-manno-octulosonate cytidylyltransferase [Flavobacteriales bacterium]